MTIEQSRKILLFAPRWVEVTIVLFAAWLLAGALVSSGDTSKTNSMVVPLSGDQTNALTVDTQFLQQVALFGQAKSIAKEVIKSPEITPVVASRLNIKLIGTVVAGKKSAAMVTVDNSSKQAVFFLEEDIQPGVKLEQVEATEIVVNNHGKRERISLVGDKALANTMPERVVAAPVRQMPDRISKRIDKANLHKQMRNFSTLLSQARVSPHFTDKKADGFTISEIVKGSLYEEIGLQNGDVIQKVNGESVTSAEQAMRMYRELQNSTFIDVEINRGGNIQQVNYAIQ